MYYNMFISLFKSFAGGERDTCYLARDIYKNNSVRYVYMAEGANYRRDYR